MPEHKHPEALGNYRDVSYLRYAAPPLIFIFAPFASLQKKPKERRNFSAGPQEYPALAFKVKNPADK